MQSYIVRIYRKQKDHSQDLVGLVEEVGTQEEKSFRSSEELRQILKGPEGSIAPAERGETGEKGGGRQKRKKSKG